MKDTFISIDKKVSAIIICDPADPVSGNIALRYSHVDNDQRKGVETFVAFARKFPTAIHINFYSKTDRRYLGRVYLT